MHKILGNSFKKHTKKKYLAFEITNLKKIPSLNILKFKYYDLRKTRQKA